MVGARLAVADLGFDVAGQMAVELYAPFTALLTDNALERVSVVSVEAVVEQVERAVLEDDVAMLTLVHLALGQQERHLKYRTLLYIHPWTAGTTPENLCSLDNTLFQTNITAIYPKELLQSNSSDGKATFLDLDIQIHNLHCTIKIYDKRDDLISIFSIFLALMVTFQ